MPSSGNEGVESLVEILDLVLQDLKLAVLREFRLLLLLRRLHGLVLLGDLLILRCYVRFPSHHLDQVGSEV